MTDDDYCISYTVTVVDVRSCSRPPRLLMVEHSKYPGVFCISIMNTLTKVLSWKHAYICFKGEMIHTYKALVCGVFPLPIINYKLLVPTACIPSPLQVLSSYNHTTVY